MAYVDYSSQFVLDMFFTYLQANQLGSNDQHIYDSLAVEHNVNTATVDGTHKANSIIGDYINKTSTDGSATITSSGGNNTQYWTPVAGVYQVYPTGTADSGPPGTLTMSFEVYISGAWRTSDLSANGVIFLGFFDGTNMRLSYVFAGGGSSGGGTIRYQKF